MLSKLFSTTSLGLVACLVAGAASADDGYELWLRYDPMEEGRAAAKEHARAIVTGTPSPTLKAASKELSRGLEEMLGTEPSTSAEVSADGAILLGTPESLPQLAELDLGLDELEGDGYVIESVEVDGHSATAIAANTETGALYGAFAYLREMATDADMADLTVATSPALDLRLLNHWDNLDRTVERGYAGFSIWDWWTLPETIRPRYEDYARANASLGINGTVLNNVNATPDILRPRYIEKAAALADVFRPYGIKVYLAVNFNSPAIRGGLPTSDPLDPQVQEWWQEKVDAIYEEIPDFGGFLVKANSEGQPGPQDFGRSHAEGANMLAEALAPHDGVVMWRAFVYSAEDSTDRAAQALNEFAPLDGEFDDNVILQVKNGPIDFQPREPFHPMFGQMEETPLMVELQVTKEYLGQGTHLAYLGALYEEVLDSDTHVEGEGSTVAKVIEGEVHDQSLTGMAGVSNIGTDRNWTGGLFDQANWYALGRFAWNPEADAREIAENWAKLTFTNDESFVEPVVDMMMGSREAVVNYMTPLGLHHQMATGHHYGPGPWVSDLDRPEWNPVYYAQADEEGIGFDRTESGSDAIAQYAPEVQEMFADPETIDEKYLLWFHHVPWDFEMDSGATLWDSLVEHYDRGVAQVEEMQETWAGVEDQVDPERFALAESFLQIQRKEAEWWRNASLAYFHTFSGMDYPEGHAAPPKDLEYYKSLEFPYAPGH